MVFSTQFALSLELASILPTVGRAANKAADALMRRARDLHHSGSDIVVEEDLANVFGRCRISLTLTSSFKTVVTNSTSNVPLLEQITLQGGPGPTVIRAFQESPYFAMVVQLSLLAWTFDSNYLATAITDALRNRLEGAPISSVLQSSPDRQGILKVLMACELQTSAFNWNMILNAVSRTLGYTPDKAPLDFPCFVLQALLDMFPMVQTLPSDRLVHIQIPVGENLKSGISTLVVWAHHVLDLTVLVRSREITGQPPKLIRFGNSDSEQVLVEEVGADHEASIILLDSRREHLLTVKPDPDVENDGLIGTVRRTPARGWGNALLFDSLGHLHFLRTRSQAVAKDLQIITSAFAFIVAKHLIRDDTDRHRDEDMPQAGAEMIYKVDEKRLLQASRFLFDNPHISQGAINSLVAQYSYKALHDSDSLPRPPAIEAVSRAHVPAENREWTIKDGWSQILNQAIQLSIFLLALAHVVNPEDCEDLRFAGFAFGSMCEHPLAQQLEEWNGKDALRIQDNAWLQAMAIPLLGHRTHVWNLQWDRICLISDRGWSAWISTLGDLDPSFVSVGSVRVGRGSPCRNGVWKAGILDSQPGNSYHFNISTDVERAQSCGQATSLRCAEKVTMESPYCGEGDDVFLVSARLRLHDAIPNQKPVHGVGYKALQKYLWWAQLSKACSHGGQMRKDIKLDVDCATIKGFGYYLHDTDERIQIYLTAHSVGARWLALAMVPWISVNMEEEEELVSRHILLRVNNCCFQCVIDQAAAQPGKWFIIL